MASFSQMLMQSLDDKKIDYPKWWDPTQPPLPPWLHPMPKPEPEPVKEQVMPQQSRSATDTVQEQPYPLTPKLIYGAILLVAMALAGWAYIGDEGRLAINHGDIEGVVSILAERLIAGVNWLSERTGFDMRLILAGFLPLGSLWLGKRMWTRLTAAPSIREGIQVIVDSLLRGDPAWKIGGSQDENVVTETVYVSLYCSGGFHGFYSDGKKCEFLTRAEKKALGHAAYALRKKLYAKREADKLVEFENLFRQPKG